MEVLGERAELLWKSYRKKRKRAEFLWNFYRESGNGAELLVESLFSKCRYSTTGSPIYTN